MTMLQTVMNSIAYVASDSLQVFFICNLIILVVLVSSLKTGPDDQQRILCTKIYNDWTGEEKVCCDLPGREVSISVKEVPHSYSRRTDDDDEKLRMVEVPGVNTTVLCSYENNLRTSEGPRAQIQSVRNDDQLRNEGESFNDNCIVENNSDEMYDYHVEEDDQFRKRVEAFISKMNSGLRDEMMQTARLALCS